MVGKVGKEEEELGKGEGEEKGEGKGENEREGDDDMRRETETASRGSKDRHSLPLEDEDDSLPLEDEEGDWDLADGYESISGVGITDAICVASAEPGQPPAKLETVFGKFFNKCAGATKAGVDLTNFADCGLSLKPGRRGVVIRVKEEEVTSIISYSLSTDEYWSKLQEYYRGEESEGGDGGGDMELHGEEKEEEKEGGIVKDGGAYKDKDKDKDKGKGKDKDKDKGKDKEKEKGNENEKGKEEVTGYGWSTGVGAAGDAGADATGATTAVGAVGEEDRDRNAEVRVNTHVPRVSLQGMAGKFLSGTNKNEFNAGVLDQGTKSVDKGTDKSQGSTDTYKGHSRTPSDVPSTGTGTGAGRTRDVRDDYGRCDEGFNEMQMLSQRKSHIRHRFIDEELTHNVKCKYICHTFWATQFRALRSQYFQEAGDEGYIRSLSRSSVWNVAGGKSGAVFSKSIDGRLVVKSVSLTELQMFLDFAPAYFEYQAKTLFEGLPSVLCRILGVYQVGFHNKVTGRKV
jgi:hypothetical protein